MLKVISSTKELLDLRSTQRDPVGFVPTMGNLHAGHLSLLKSALEKFQIVYFSIFVNPKQFGPNEDFNRYPRTLEQDIKLIEKLLLEFKDKTVIVFAPQDPSEVFPQDDQQSITVTGLSEQLEGKIRPGHFAGVATVVYKLFKLIRPTKSYFGLKDYQQYLVIKQMVRDLALPIEIVGMPIVREESGLAMSSRNQYLSEEEKEQGLILFRTLKKVEEMINHSKNNLNQAKDFINITLKDNHWNYLIMVDAETLSVDIENSKKIAILGVYQLRTTRLLDNLQVEMA
ncbi:MAG: pantoate--beta-alanine ligase [Bacteriovoracaceae bacterium]